MKIIKLGNFDVRLMCLCCKTIIELSTEELIRDDYDKWHCICPLCGETIHFDKECNKKVSDFLNKRDTLKVENNL